MTVEIEVFGALLPAERRNQYLETDGTTTVNAMALALGLNPDDIGLVTVDGVQARMEDIVPQTCRLCFFPPMSGG
jgi:hypothetical protein